MMGKIAYLSASYKDEKEAAHKLLIQISGKDFGYDEEKWRTWINSLEYKLAFYATALKPIIRWTRTAGSASLIDVPQTRANNVGIKNTSRLPSSRSADL